MSMGVFAVMRRLNFEDRSRFQPFLSRCSCITVTPCAACMKATACGCWSSHALPGAAFMFTPVCVGQIISPLTYSWFTQTRPRAARP
jgi:hypothetical protein